MNLFEIKDRYSGVVLFSLETESLKQCVEMAVSQKAHLGRADLRGANLWEANLWEANFWEADFGGADLGGADLGRANLRGANLRGANLWEANFWGADLGGADLGGANLRRANLWGTNLRGTNLERAHLGGAFGIFTLGSPDGWHTHAWLRDDVLSVRVGCHELRIDEARQYWTGKDNRHEVMAALDYAQAVATIRGWNIS